MMVKTHIQGGDFFCGAGGGSTAFIAACEELNLTFDLLAINHWDVAIATHSANHPNVRHICENLDSVFPRKVVPGGRLHFALFAPECTDHSRAKGGRPKNEQSRATAWHVIRWAEEIEIDNILVENVAEFVEWGPLYPNDHPVEKLRGKKIPEKKGTFFKEWCRLLRSRGYKFEYRILGAAFYGGATSRARFFLQAKKIKNGKIPRITWPESTHEASENLFGKPKFRGAKEIIDWSLQGKSIYGRKKPLAENTHRRIFAGVKKFSGLPFILGQQSCSAPRSTNDPMPTISTAGAISLIQPFLVILRHNCDALSIDGPVPTICAEGNHIGIAEPFIVPQFSSQGARSIERPLGTLTTQSRGVGLCEPFVVPVTHSNDLERTHDVEKPLPTITTAKGGEMALVEPYLIHMEHSTEASGHERRSLSTEAPLPTPTARAAFGLCAPFLTKFHGPQVGRQERVYPVDEPIQTLDTSNRFGVVQPCLVSFKGNDEAADLEKPLQTITSKDRFALCEPFIVPPEGIHRGNAPRSLDAPTQTITSRGGGHLAEPFIVSYYGNGGALSINEPLDTVTGKDRFALVEPAMIEIMGIDKGDIVGVLDIRFRMLQPHELSAAMGFPAGYQFHGNKEEQVKQIGNSIEHNVCKALCIEMLRPYAAKPKGRKKAQQ